MVVNPDLQLDGAERAHLATIAATEGFRVLKNLMEAEVAKFQIKLLNTKAEDAEAVLAAHKMCKAAAQFYQGVIERVYSEVELHTHAPRRNDPPMADITADLFNR